MLKLDQIGHSFAKVLILPSLHTLQGSTPVIVCIVNITNREMIKEI